MRRRWHPIQRLKQFRYDPLMPLVYVGVLGILAYFAFIFNWLSHGW